jgi:pentatricopeptide repeat protein
MDLYAKCGELEKAQAVFDELLPFRNVASWNILIGGYAQYSYCEEALRCYARLQCEAFSPDAVTCICAVKACSSMEVYGMGKMVHATIRIDGSKEEDLLLGNALVDMYGRCGDLSHAQEAFGRVQHRDVGTWNALIASCIRNKHVDDAFEVFDQMHEQGFDPNAVTLVCILKACASVKALCRGKEIHLSVADTLVLSQDLILGNALIDMYAKCGALGEAREVFDGLSCWDVVSSTTLISGYSQQGQPEEAIGCFDQMHHRSLFANSITFACILDACGLAGALRKGKEVHAQIVSFMHEEGDLLVGNALVDMYGKCGELAQAQDVFDRLLLRDVVTWTSIITGYAKIGEDDMVLEVFCAMIDEGVEPSISTFTVVLCACSHSGHLGEAQQMYCWMMNASYGAMPTLEHLTCMIDLFGRAGYFGEAIAVIRSMPTINYLPAWIALLGACQKWGNVELGRTVFEHAVELDQMDGSLYVCMRNIYGVALVQAVEELDVMGVASEAPLAALIDCRFADSKFC